MKKKIILCGLLALFAIISCTEKDLEVLPDGQELDATFYKTDDQIILALNGAYDPFQWVIWGGSTFLWGSITSDDAVGGGSGPLDQSGFQICDRFIASPVEGVNKDSYDFYRLWWVMNGRANSIIKYADANSSIGKKAISHAYFLKGMAYYQLTRLYGGLPIINDYETINDKFPRSTQDETWLACEGYLENAVSIGGLTKRSGFSDPDDGLATLGSAQALLGKVYIYHQKYAEAISVLEQLVADGNYALEENYGDIFWPGNRHGKESIFEINFTNSGNWDGAQNNGNVVTTLVSPRSNDNPVVYPNSNFMSGWGMNQPTKKLATAFDAMGDVVRKKNSIITCDSIEAANGPQVWQNALTENWDLKHIIRTEYYTSPTAVFCNLIVLRYSDVLLLLAEAYNKTGDDVNARKYLNMVRERAHLDDVTVSGNELLTAIKKERQLELCLEGDRYFDLVRWGDAAAELKAEEYDADGLDYTTGKPGVTTNGLFPIPYDEMAAYGDFAGFPQNPGY